MSNINYTGINRDFPVAGQDNDTQVFKDNWDVIATSLQAAKEEITDLQDNVVRTDLESNDFEKHVINNAVLQNVRTQKFDGGAPSENITIDFENGSYQIYRFGADVDVDFLNFPGDPVFTDETVPIGMGKVTLELYSDGTARTITFVTSGGTVIKKQGFAGSANEVVLESADNPIFIEVWRHSEETIFMRNLGEFA